MAKVFYFSLSHFSKKAQDIEGDEIADRNPAIERTAHQVTWKGVQESIAIE